MGTIPRYLCLILALSIVSFCPSADIRAGLRDSSLSRGTKDVSAVLQAARRRREAGDFAAAEKLYLQGFARAKVLGDEHTAAPALMAAANCQVLQFHYRSALESYLEARRLATSSGDALNRGAIELSLSNLYEQVGDLVNARLSAEQALTVIARVPKIYYKAQLLMQLARLQGPDRDNAAADDMSERLLGDAIEIARSQGDAPLEARAWDLLGQQRLERGRVADAEKALDQALLLRALRDRKEKASSYAKLGALKLAQGDVDTASTFTDRALAQSARATSPWPKYRLVHQRGQIRRARGDIDGALRDFREAAELTAQWRAEVLPAAAPLDGANEYLEKKIFDSFIETGAAESLRTNGRQWARETFQALEFNRSQSLRQTIGLAGVAPKQRESELWDTLGELRSEEARLLHSGKQSSEVADRHRLKLTEMEAEMGLGFPPNTHREGENFRSRGSLTHIQDGLSDRELLLSFHVGVAESYLWTVSRNALSLHRLPAAERLRDEVVVFREAIRTRSTDVDEIGARLYAELFGDLNGFEIGKTEWLLSLEDALFDLPLAALIAERKDAQVTYLVEKHSLQIVPGALSLVRSRERATTRTASEGGRRFLGVGDPIYNTADPRWKLPDQGSAWRSRNLWSAFAGEIRTFETGDGTGQFNRLVGSGSEIESSSRSWTAGSGTATLLRGAEAERQKFLGLLAPRHSANGPFINSPVINDLVKNEPAVDDLAVIHLATHVIAPREHAGLGRGGSAFIAFTLDSSGQTEFLTTKEVAALHVPGMLVVMTGCDTGAGEVRAGAGLLGLTRAWLTAGAGGVLATLWPVRDSGGEIFSTFHRSLKGVSAAEALRRSQVMMIRSRNIGSHGIGSHGIRSQSGGTAMGDWASYQITGGVH